MKHTAWEWVVIVAYGVSLALLSWALCVAWPPSF